MYKATSNYFDYIMVVDFSLKCAFENIILDASYTATTDHFLG